MSAPAVSVNTRSLDWLNFFVADVQTGFGPFVASYLTEHKWTQGEIGLALSVGTATAMVSQIPAGALVDAMRQKRTAAALAIMAITFSAVLLACSPTLLPVLVSEVLHGFASCMLTPAIAALTLSLVGRHGLGERLGLNARWASLGSGLAAAAMGLLGDALSTRAVFWFTALLGAPSLAALYSVPRAPTPKRISAALPAVPAAGRESLKSLFSDRRLLIFGGCIMLFQLSNAAMLNLAAGEATAKVEGYVQLIIAACIVVPQAVVVVMSPWVGRAAMTSGRRWVLALGFAALPVRAVLFSVVESPYLLVPIQALDGIGAAVMGVMLPLIAADIAGGSGRYNLCLGALGLAAGIGATLSTSAAGFIADAFGIEAAFLALAAAGAMGTCLVWWGMPETAQVAVPEAVAD